MPNLQLPASVAAFTSQPTSVGILTSQPGTNAAAIMPMAGEGRDWKQGVFDCCNDPKTGKYTITINS